MEKKPSVDLSLWLPILFGVLSIMGIVAVFLFGRFQSLRPKVTIQPSETPFRFIYLGTEPGLSTLTPEPTNTLVILPTPLPPSPVTVAPTTVEYPTTVPAFRTATPSPTIPAILSQVDDNYFELLYDGPWAPQTGVSGAYQNTLHISFKVGNSVSYTFTGQQVFVSYQAGPSLGNVTINLDGYIVEVNQSDTETQLKDWRSPILVKGTHTLVITHLSGGSVNLDSIAIPDLSTPTPTSTATSTSNP